MEAIKLSLNLEKLTVISEVLEDLKYEPTNEREVRVQRSILNDVGKRLLKKKIDVHPSNKDFKFKMEYYEADRLEDTILTYLFDKRFDNYYNLLLRKIADDINQKLA